MISVRTQSVGPWPMNAYVLVSSVTSESVLIDPGADPDKLLAMLAGTKPRAIWLTHTHMDHIAALPDMKAALQVPVLAYGSPRFEEVGVTVDHLLRDGDEVMVGPDMMRVHYAPGHIDDLICFLAEEGTAAIVGDTLFAGGPGRTWSAEGFRQTRRTLREVVLPWPDDTICYPGHGQPFRLGEIRPQIQAFLGQDFGDFYGDASWDMAPDTGDIEIIL